MKHVKRVDYDENGFCRIILDDFTVLEIDAFVASHSEIEPDSDIDDDVLEELILEGECVKAQKIALKLINIKMRTEKQLEKALLEKGISNAAALKTVENMKIYGYIDDETYARTYIDYRIESSKKSWRAIFYDLKLAGIDADVLERVKSDYDIDEYERALFVAEKTLRGKNDDCALKKLQGVLSRNGFSWDAVKHALNEMSDSELEDY